MDFAEGFEEGVFVGDAFELAVVGGFEHGAEGGTGGVAAGDEVASGDDGGGQDGFGGVFRFLGGQKIIDVQLRVGAEAIEAVQFERPLVRSYGLKIAAWCGGKFNADIKPSDHTGIRYTISIPTLSHSEGIRRIRELREAAFAAIEEMR